MTICSRLIFLTILLGLVLPPKAKATVAVTVERLPDALAKKTISLNPDFLVLSTREEMKASEGEEKEKKQRPLVIYLHGSGGRGTDLAAKRPVPPIVRSLELFATEPVWVIVPQCLPGSLEDKRIWQPADLNVLLDYARSLLPIDERRIILTGFSMGGYGSWAWGAANPEHFAAVAPVAGGLGPGGPADVTPHLAEWAKALATVPLWAWHGADDTVVPAERSERMVRMINEQKNGQEARLTLIPDMGHGSQGTAYANEEFVKWLLAQRRFAEEEEG